MRIAFLCKRRYMSHDVIDDRYARLYEIPHQLARLGHTVHGFCLGYQGQASAEITHEAQPGELQWTARGLGTLRAPRMLGYPRWLAHCVRSFEPDLLIGASDIPHVALTGWLARRLHLPYAIDLYDNFEGFGQARIPGMVGALRRATREAGLVTTTSDLLAELVRERYRARGTVMSMPSTINKEIFAPGDRKQSRERLGLPLDVPLIGTAGGLHVAKGIGTLYDAWASIAESWPTAHLVLAGPLDGKRSPPAGKRVHYLGMLPHARMADLFRALDVGVIYLRDTPFGRYCFPQKAYEMAGCGLNFVAANVGAMPALLRGAPDSLYLADDPADLAQTVCRQMREPVSPHLHIEDWRTLVSRLEAALGALLEPQTDFQDHGQ